jgi:hypothetical protein
MLTVVALTLFLVVVFAGGAVRQWIHGDKKTSVSLIFITVLLAWASFGLIERLRNAKPIDLIRQPVSCAVETLAVGCH